MQRASKAMLGSVFGAGMLLGVWLRGDGGVQARLASIDQRLERLERIEARSDADADPVASMIAKLDRLEAAVERIPAAEGHSETARAVPFVMCPGHFMGTDSINIESMKGNCLNLGSGCSFVVRGRYALGSRDAAALGVFATGGDLEGDTLVDVARGSGAFEISFRIARPGMLHVSFYPATGGGSFGGIYFGSTRCDDGRPSWQPPAPPPGRDAIGPREVARALSHLTISRAYWLDEAREIASWVNSLPAARELGHVGVMVHVDEQLSRSHRYLYGNYMRAADLNFVLRAEGHAEIPAHAQDWWWHSEVYLGIERAAFEQMVPGVAYRLVARNDAPVQWIVRGEVTLARAR